MSVDARPQSHLRQRRLGILRSAHSPRVRAHSTGILESNVRLANLNQNCDEIERSLKSSLQFHEVYNDKVRKLHQIRSDNAVKKMRVQSCSDMNRSNNIVHDACSLRCSTAPSYGTVRQFLKDKVFRSVEADEDSVFEENAVLDTSSTKKLGRRNRLATFPSINSEQISPNSLQGRSVLSHSTTDKNETRYISKKFAGNNISVSSKPALCNKTSPKLRRSSSAPADVYRNSLLKEEELLRRSAQYRTRQHTYSSLIKSDSKRQTKPPILRHALFHRQNSTLLKSSLASEVQPTKNSKPLGIVGEPFKSNKPHNFVKPIYKLPLRRPGLPNPIKISPRLSVSSFDSEQSHKQPVCVIPNQSSAPYTSCPCRSVRFNCTDNTIYEYVANDPVSSSVETIKK